MRRMGRGIQVKFKAILSIFEVIEDVGERIVGVGVGCTCLKDKKILWLYNLINLIDEQLS